MVLAPLAAAWVVLTAVAAAAFLSWAIAFLDSAETGRRARWPLLGLCLSVALSQIFELRVALPLIALLAAGALLARR